MDTSDPEIVFDDAGICNHCRNVDDLRRRKQWLPNDEGKATIAEWVARVKREQANSDYDCVLGLSGGCDSSYLAVQAKKFGLRCLVVHVDAGWNSAAAVRNIEVLVKGLGFDLITHVVDWQEMRDLQVAFLRAGVPNQDIPQDHIFFSVLYSVARKLGIKFQLQGRNFASESVLPKAWGYNAMDGTHLRAIHARFGSVPLKHYRVMSTWEYVDYFVGLPWRSAIEVFDPLNYMAYDPSAARRELVRDYGWSDYGQKHWESHWTRFFQSYYLPLKFGFDKRRAHLSSLVLSGLLSRDDALRELQAPPADEQIILRETEFVRRKLELDERQWREIIDAPTRMHSDYPSAARNLLFGMRAALAVKELSLNMLSRVALKSYARVKNRVLTRLNP